MKPWWRWRLWCLGLWLLFKCRRVKWLHSFGGSLMGWAMLTEWVAGPDDIAACQEAAPW